MSRWTENKFNYKKHYDVWIDSHINLYRVTTDQGTIDYKTRGRLDYKKTVKNFLAAGYTNINICYIGRQVVF